MNNNLKNIFIRNVIAGLINFLNKKIFYLNYGERGYDIIEVPFYYSLTGDERFLQDYYLNWSDCYYPTKIEGNFDPIPRGVITFSSMSIDTAALTQKWIRGEFSRLYKGKYEKFSANIYSLPIKMSFNIELRTDSIVESFKIIQSIFDILYKVQIFNIDFRGFMIPCQISFPENYPVEKSFEFSYSSERLNKTNFEIEIETYYPIVDDTKFYLLDLFENVKNEDEIRKLEEIIFEKYNSNNNWSNNINYNNGGITMAGYSNIDPNISSLRKSSQKMKKLIMDAFEADGDVDIKDKIELKLLTPIHNEEYLSNSILEITWDYDGWLHYIDIYYSIDNGENWNEIVKFYPANLRLYQWFIPEFEKHIDGYIITNYKVKRNAKVKFFANENGEIEDYIIIDGGNGYIDNMENNVELSDNNGNGAEIIPIINNGKIVGFNIINKGNGYKYINKINLIIKISSSSNKNIMDVIKNKNNQIGSIIIK